MVLLVDYLTELDIVLIMQKMEAVSFSRFRRASKRLYKLADEAKNLSVMVDRRLFLYGEKEQPRRYTLKAAVCEMRSDILWSNSYDGSRCPPQNSIIMPPGNSSSFIGFTFSQLEIIRDIGYSGLKKGSEFPVLKDCNWKRTTLITVMVNDLLFEVVHPKEIYLSCCQFKNCSKPLPISIKRMNCFYAHRKVEMSLFKHMKHVVYRHLLLKPKELIHAYFEYWFYEDGVMTEILEVRPFTELYFPVVLSIEGAIKHVEDTAFEMIVPHFYHLHWEKIDSSVTYCNRTVNNDFQRGEETNLEMFDMTLTHRAKCKNQWIYAVLKLEAVRPWKFNSNLQILFSNRF